MPHRGILRNCRATCPARPATMSTSSRDGLLALSVMVVPFRPSSPPPLQTKLDCAIPSAEPAELHFRQRFGVDTRAWLGRASVPQVQNGSKIIGQPGPCFTRRSAYLITNASQTLSHSASGRRRLKSGQPLRNASAMSSTDQGDPRCRPILRKAASREP